MLSDELADYEIKSMTYSAYKVCEEVTARIDRLPERFQACRKGKMFFKHKEYLSVYLSKSEKKKAQLPGAAYCKQLTEFMDLYFEVGMKYLEILKFNCMKTLGKACKFVK